MTTTNTADISAAIATAAASGIDLTPSDFQIVNGDAYIDGMNPTEWIEAMTMD